MKEPVFLKESSNSEIQLEKLKSLEPLLNPDGQAILKQDIKCLESGIYGENNIAFELKNSHIPMYILHDLYLEDGDLSAQIDYLVFTKKICFVIECKNLYGDIEINSAGDFIRTTDFGGRKKKEGIYSPITQNQRHLELMKKIRIDKSNIFAKLVVGKYFEDCHKSVVVLANPKTVLNAKFAKKEVKEKVIRADQLVKYIKDTYEQSKEGTVSDERLLEWAQSYLNLHKEVVKDYTDKYEQFKIETVKAENPQELITNQKVEEIPAVSIVENLEETDIFKEFKAYRLRKSREENIKPYFIFNDNQLKDLIAKMPRSKEELRLVAGFGEAKASKYGEDILQIANKY
jgi:Superfamily II DNA helicase